MTIYIDVVLIENLIMNYIILLATGVVLKNNIKHFRIILGSIIGAVYSILTYIITIQVFSSLIFKILLSIIMVYVAFNPQNVKKLWKYLLIFYLTSFVFGGAAYALIYIIKPQEVLIKNGLFLGTYPLKNVALAGMIGFFTVTTTFKIVKNRITKKDIYKDITIKMNEKIINIKAMIDTGNMLKDPITNIPVIVVEKVALYNLLPKELLDNSQNLLAGKLSDIDDNIKENYIKKIRFIPFSSLGKQNGMLIGIKPDFVSICDEQDVNKFENIIVGVYERTFTKDKKYQALMGIL